MNCALSPRVYGFEPPVSNVMFRVSASPPPAPFCTPCSTPFYSVHHRAHFRFFLMVTLRATSRFGARGRLGGRPLVPRSGRAGRCGRVEGAGPPEGEGGLRERARRRCIRWRTAPPESDRRREGRRAAPGSVQAPRAGAARCLPTRGGGDPPPAELGDNRSPGCPRGDFRGPGAYSPRVLSEVASGSQRGADRPGAACSRRRLRPTGPAGDSAPLKPRDGGRRRGGRRSRSRFPAGVRGARATGSGWGGERG